MVSNASAGRDCLYRLPGEECDEFDDEARSWTSSVQLSAELLSAEGIDLGDLNSQGVRQWAAFLRLEDGYEMGADCLSDGAGGCSHSDASGAGDA